MKHLTSLDKRLMGLKIKSAFENDDVNYDNVMIERAVDTVEEHWEAAKSKRLFDLFGDKLMVTKEIFIEKDAVQLAEEVTNLCHPFIRKLKSEIGTACYIDEKMSRELYYTIDNMCYRSLDLGTNRISHSFEFVMEGVKTFKVSKGQKTLKFFQKLTDIFGIDQELFEDFRIKHSQVLNDKKIKGTLVLSIHPLDYMTMSDNANNWDSCMSWDYHGCYRAGTLECMNCPSTIVAYMASSTREYHLGEDEYWNSKKYRQLVMIDDNAIMTNKGYPYQNDSLSREVLHFVAELAGEDYEGEDHSYDDYVPFEVDGLRGVYLETRCHMYNDINNGARAMFRMNKNFETTSNGCVKMTLGGEARCLICGDYIEDAEELYCYDCSDRNKRECDCCGERVDEDECYWVDDDCLCWHCFERETSCCEHCGETSYTGNMTYISPEETKEYVVNSTGNTPYDGYYCQWCYENALSNAEVEEEVEEEQ